MSGDVQPRKRKDKKKKRDSLDARKSEGELIFSRKSSLQAGDESSHGVHMTKMGTEDIHLHVQQEHDTGGHCCAKIVFFSLLVILVGLVMLIIFENRGIKDVDTPLSESRFSNYFNGWVDEHRAEHDDHHEASHDSLEHDDDDDHEHDDEPFEEEADISEGEEEVADDEDDKNVTPEEENEEENATGENVTAEEVGEEDEEDEDNVTVEEEDNVTVEDERDENVTLEDENITAEQNDKADDDEDDNITKETTKSTSKGVHDDEEDTFDEEEDDDGNFDSLENIVENDAAELELLKEKARQQVAAESKQNTASAENDIDDEVELPSWASSQIKPKAGGGPQSVENDDFNTFEEELRQANDEMMREFNYH